MFNKFIIAYDHRAEKKYIDSIKQTLKENNIDFFEVLDGGKDNDYPILASKAYSEFLSQKADGMILLCGTGIGMNVVANKCDGIRAVLANSEAEAYFARRHENANCIVFGAGYSDGIQEVKLCRRKMVRMLSTFLVTDFEGDRHVRRLNEIAEIEKGRKF